MKDRTDSMLFSDDVLFIHAPKTAGISVTEFLIRNLPGDKAMTLPEGHGGPRADVDVLPGTRHENLAQAGIVLEGMGRSLGGLRLILAVIRNPYDLEVSRFGYLRLGRPWDKGPLQNLAMTGDFDRFCREALYPYIWQPLPIESFYTLDGETPPPNMRLLRYERLAADLADALAPICEVRHPLGHENVSERGRWEDYITPENEPYIFAKYRWLFRFYPRVGQ